jgi:ubiquinone/menaquinone biosynthesis C-methylase UbiE
MKTSSLPFLRCPACRSLLEFYGEHSSWIETGIVKCRDCGRAYPIRKGIPHFIEPETLSGLNRKFSRSYDFFSHFYRLFSKLAFAYIGMKEENGRREITDRLQPGGGKVLEVSIGPGVNLPYLMNRPDVNEVIGLDISLGQLERCQAYTRSKGWQVDLCLASAEELPFHDDTFEGVFHVGGINFFSDKAAAIREMIRVARPGATILIADENEKGARAYERTLPGFKKTFDKPRSEVVPPVDLVPPEMQNIHLFNVWKGWMYCLEFLKP